MPENGARIVFRSMVARISATLASVAFCWAVAWSYSIREITPAFTSCCIRPKFIAHARARSAPQVKPTGPVLAVYRARRARLLCAPTAPSQTRFVRRPPEGLLQAFQNVAYYHDKFREYGVSEQDIVRFRMDDLPRFPLLDKPFVRANRRALAHRQAAKRPPKCFQTSGTTGTPLRRYWDFECHQHNIAVRAARSFRWAGVLVISSHGRLWPAA